MNARESYPNFLRKTSKHVLLNIRLSISSTLATEQQDSVSCYQHEILTAVTHVPALHCGIFIPMFAEFLHFERSIESL